MTMENKEIEKLVRKNVLELSPYSSARDEYSDGGDMVFLDANENPYDTGFNRYPDPHQKEIKKLIAKRQKIDLENIILGNGSDEVIDLLFKTFCDPGKDNIIILPPTYGMYQVSAGIHNVEVRQVELKSDFQPNIDAILKAVDANTKLLFLCSPNNPTGNLVEKKAIVELAEKFKGIIVIDEAYIDFTEEDSNIDLLGLFPRVFVMQTFSKSWGLAGIRLGVGFAHKTIIEMMNKVKPPYNISKQTQNIALLALTRADSGQELIKGIQQHKKEVIEALRKCNLVVKIYPSDANFLLVKFKDAPQMYKYLIKQGIVVRDRSKMPLCDNCLRITIGTSEENDRLIDALNYLEK